jgi:hypothetical protein
VALAASTWSDLRATFTLNSSFSNLAIIVWSSDALAQNATLDLSAVQIERGATATPFEARPIAAERALCQRYYRIWRGDDGNVPVMTAWRAGSNTALRVMRIYYDPMRARPTTITSPTNPTWETAPSSNITGNKMGWYDDAASAFIDNTGTISWAAGANDQVMSIAITSTAAFTGSSGGDVGQMYWGSSVYVALDAEL